jgi:hypothetical protein
MSGFLPQTKIKEKGSAKHFVTMHTFHNQKVGSLKYQVQTFSCIISVYCATPWMCFALRPE